MKVSCVMPTYNRRQYIKAAIDCFLSQDYEPRELIIVDDGEDKVRDLVPSDPRIRYVETARITTGAKRNMCNGLAQGEIIVHCDDDDWSVPNRISRQVELLQTSGKPVTGFSRMLYWDLIEVRAKLYASQSPGYVVGLTLCYLRDWWKKHPFPDVMKSSDNEIINPNKKDIAAFPDIGLIVARAHDTNIGGNKRGIGPEVSKEMIPAAFWENEKLRLSHREA